MTHPSKRIQTTRELTDLAGVSHMTVSRIFKNPDKVKKETRERVLALAEEVGFRPNPVLSMAMAIRNQQKKEGGVCLPAVKGRLLLEVPGYFSLKTTTGYSQ